MGTLKLAVNEHVRRNPMRSDRETLQGDLKAIGQFGSYRDWAFRAKIRIPNRVVAWCDRDLLPVYSKKITGV